MTEADKMEQELLYGLCAALEPSLDDQLRIREHLAQSLVASSGIAPAPGSSPLAGKSLLGSRLVQLCLAVGLSASIGLAVGYHLGTKRAPRSLVLTAPLSAPTFMPIAAGVELDNSSASKALPLPHVELKRATVVNATASAEPLAVDPLFEEMALLKRAERAIRGNNGLLAMALVRELDERFPKGQLMEEREAARVMAGCETQGVADGQQLGQQYLERYPHTVYAERVRSLCRLASNVTTESETSGN